MKTKTTLFLLALVSSLMLALPAQARDEHRGSRWDHHRNYDYRDHDRHRSHHGWRHHGHGSGHRVYVEPRHYYYPDHHSHRYYYRDGHRHHRHHHQHHHNHDALTIIGGAVLLNEILHH